MTTNGPDLEPATILGPRWPEHLKEDYLRASKNDPLEAIIALALEHGVETVLVERRYIDPDYRSEHSRFYAGTFHQHRAFCDRLHFFTGTISDGLDLSQAQAQYKGYSIMRPSSSNPVGRTMIAPPAALADACVCVATEEVHPFGFPLSITAMPFISQDEQYLRCAHAAQWMVLYHAYLAHRLPRRLPEDIHESSKSGRVVGRQVPAEGLSPSQILRGLQALQLSAGMIELPRESRSQSEALTNTSLFALLCRYVNSTMPPIVVSRSHAWVVVAYQQAGEKDHNGTVLYRHDDARGPYIRVEDPWNEKEPEHENWWFTIPPMPQRLYLSAERAEPIARFWFERGTAAALERFAESTPATLLGEPIDSGLFDQQRQRLQDLVAGIVDGTVMLRTFAIRSHEFKARTADRLPRKIAKLYRGCHLPGHVWVVEAIRREAAGSGRRCVLGEVIIDPTTNHTSQPDVASRPAILALNLAGMAFVYHPDHEEVANVEIAEDFEVYESGCPAWGWTDARVDANT